MTRTRLTIKKIETLDEADEALKEIKIRELTLEKIKNETEQAIQKIREDAAKKAKPYQNEIAAIENALALFGDYNKDELFSKKKSITLNFGNIGFRKSTKVSTKKTTLELLKKFGLKTAIRTKETIDKDELKKWDKEKLAQVGAKLKEDDIFYYETNELMNDMVQSA